MTVERQVSNELDKKFLAELARSHPLGPEEALFVVYLIQEGKMITSGAFWSMTKSKVELIAEQMVSFGVLVASWATSYSTAKLINLELAIVTLYQTLIRTTMIL